MQCESCGATVPDGASSCPECGASVAASPAAVSSEGSAAAAAKAPKRRTWGVLLGVLVALAVIGAGVYFISQQFASQNGPDKVALKFFQAYGAYDGQTMLDLSTHSSLNTTDEATFVKQSQDYKKTNKGLPIVKEITVKKVDLASKEATMATVQLSMKWLTDVPSAKYVDREEVVTLFKINGAWKVRLFQ